MCLGLLIAEEGGIAVGTLTVGFDGPRGLRCDETYPDEIRVVRSEGRRVCEPSALALAEGAAPRAVLSQLYRLAYAIGILGRGVTDVFIEVNPRQVGYYRRVLGFVVEAGERVCGRVQAPAVLLRVSVHELQSRLQVYLARARNLTTARSAE